MCERVEGFRLPLLMSLQASFSHVEQVEGFRAPLKMPLRATIPFVGSAGKLQRHLGNYISAGVRNLSISHSRNTDFEAFLSSFGQLPFQAHRNIIFLVWAAFGKLSHLKCRCKPYFLVWERVEGFRLPFKMSLQASFSHVGAS